MPKITQNLDKISKKLFFLVFFVVFFFKLPWGKIIFEKIMQYVLPNLDYISSNTISQL